MTDFIVQTADKRNISYIDDDIQSVWRRAIYDGLKVVNVCTLAEWHEQLYGPEYQAEVVAIHEQQRLNDEYNAAAEEVRVIA